MFAKILLATSATPACDHAARVAFNLATRYHAEINIFHVLGIPTRGFSQTVLDVKTGENVILDEEYQAWVIEELRIYYQQQLAQTPKHRLRSVAGVPHREILREARDYEADLIVMGGSTSDPDDILYKRNMVGTTLQRVARAAHCPVLVINRPAASFWGGISNVVFATDFSKAAEAAFRFALKVVRELKAEFHIFHAVDTNTAPSGDIPPQDEIDARLREARRCIMASYGAQLQGQLDYTMEAWEGLPHMEIVKYARQCQADLIVMAHHNRPMDVAEARLGSNIEQVIVRANCPVISVNH
jgi:nucleotide-binding universal stress UspA family protein